MDAQMKETYVVTLELDPRSRQWMADVEDLPVHTWGKSLAKVKAYAAEALALHLDVPVPTVAGHISFRRPQLPAHVLEALDEADTARIDAEDATARAAQAKAAAARALVREAHLSMRDAAEVLGLSHQRVQQLLAS
jgi:predicted RNase H-like HicB family nuclease